ncbi:MAG: UPF0179 family protein [Infirmifilum sp.]
MVTPLIAKPGTIFQPYVTSKCIECQFFNACIGNLRPLANYKVVNIRKHAVYCPALAEELITVEVEELPVKILVDLRDAMPGAVIRYRKPGCQENSEDCDPPYLEEGERIRILKEVEKKNNLSIVEVEFIDPPHPRLWIRARRKLLGKR